MNIGSTAFTYVIDDDKIHAESPSLHLVDLYIATGEAVRGTNVRRPGRGVPHRVASGSSKDAHHSTPGKSP